jgi:competence protein ComEC
MSTDPSRIWMSDHIRSQIPGQTGAFAAAIVTGDRSQIDPALIDDLRQSNLAHLLAISGLHMGLMTGFIFAIIRLAIAAVPFTAVRWQGKKIGAIVAFLAGIGYLLLSGANVATQRAFVMVAVMLIAVLLDRPAITLRAVAIAATLILLFRPESLTQPGFQMSFAATTALVATFETLNKSTRWQAINSGVIPGLAPVLSLVIASGVAGAATAPISAFHFNQIAQFGLVANLLSVPVMSLIVMPSAVIAGVLSLVGLQELPYWVMGQGIGWILGVANWVANLDGAVVRIPSGATASLGGFAFGMVFLVLWKGRLRMAGFAIAGAALLFWAQSPRPDILITDNGRLVGVATGQGRALSRDRGNSFAAKTWLENDGDYAAQGIAVGRGPFSTDKWTHSIDGKTVSYFWGKEFKQTDLIETCATADILVVPQWDTPISGPCKSLVGRDFKIGGSVAIWATKAGLISENAHQRSGTRLWNQ